MCCRPNNYHKNTCTAAAAARWGGVMGMGGVIVKEIRGKYVILPINNGNLIIVCLFIM